MSGKIVWVMFDRRWGYYLQWGNETFYDEDRNMITWESPEAAVEWLKENHPGLEVVNPF